MQLAWQSERREEESSTDYSVESSRTSSVDVKVNFEFRLSLLKMAYLMRLVYSAV